jgi:hypothetical protein
VSAVSASNVDGKANYHGFGFQFPLNFKCELRVIVKFSRMSSGGVLSKDIRLTILIEKKDLIKSEKLAKKPPS